MSNKSDLRVIKTKNNLYEGLLKMMRDKPFEEIKVSDICKVSLTNRSTFYDHFSDKYELLSSLIKDLENELILKLKSNVNIASSKDFYMEMIKLLFEHISENISIYSSIAKNNDNSVASDMMYDTLIKDVKSHIEDNEEYKGSIPAEIITIFYVSAVIKVCFKYISDPNKYKMEEILSYLEQLIPDNIY